MTPHYPVFLIGFMGSGKSYWGKHLSEALDRPFCDLDEGIESEAGMDISRIFETSGETGFRELEREALHHCLDQDGIIVATGGGTPCFFDNMDWMNAHGLTIYLHAPAHVLAERLRREREYRPLLRQIPEHLLEEHIAHVLAHREPFYNRATNILNHDPDDAAFLSKLRKVVTAG